MMFYERLWLALVEVTATVPCRIRDTCGWYPLLRYGILDTSEALPRV
jgi:hypothetical protein